ncbi:hypothetical protein PsYK624_125230 [Phanerochaete sordida]|uniref:Uncharacterized protein n=1 Tax=Phanerochaete sordida TaxID=48140 RepID=A0A9P3GLA1_9APHY|nr:hypothetical protein PsYK624_125230 [Phanerochaete sordida]
MEWISRTAWKSWPDVASTTTTPHELAALLDLLPHLDSLEIFGLQFADAAPRVTPQTQRGPMKHVKLISSRSFRASHTPGHLQHIVDLLCQFSHISELSVGSDSVSPLCPPSTSRRIRTDTLDVVCQSFTMQRGPTMLHALTQNTDLSAVHTLKLSEPGSVAPGQPPCAIFAAALRGCKHLQSLTCTGNASYRALAHPAPCPPLRKLRVQLGTSSRPTPLRDLWADVARLARCALASTVSALGVRIDYSHHARMAGIVEVDEDVRADVRSVAWAPVQDALAALPALRVLEVAVDVRLWAPTWTAGAEEGAVREARRRGLAALRVYVESAVLAGLPLAPGRTLRLAVSMDPVL